MSRFVMRRLFEYGFRFLLSPLGIVLSTAACGGLVWSVTGLRPNEWFFWIFFGPVSAIALWNLILDLVHSLQGKNVRAIHAEIAAKTTEVLFHGDSEAIR